MPLRDVCRFVGKHPGKLILVERGEKQAAVHRDEASRHGERVDDGVAHDEIEELMLPLLGVAGQAMPDVLHVLADFRILEHEVLLAHLPDVHQARAILVLEADRRIGRAAHVGQFLLDRPGTRDPGDAEAKRDRQRGGEGAGRVQEFAWFSHGKH